MAKQRPRQATDTGLWKSNAYQPYQFFPNFPPLELMRLGPTETRFLWREEEKGGRQQGSPGPLASRTGSRRESDSRDRWAPAAGALLLQTAFLSNLLLPSVHLLAKVHLYISVPGNLIYHLLYAYMLGGFLGDRTERGVFTRN